MKVHPIQSGPLPDRALQIGFLLIDASNLDDESFHDDLPMIRCTPRLLTNSDLLMPRLIDLAALNEEQVNRLRAAVERELNCEHPPVICAWISTSLDVDALARNISRFLVGPGFDGVSVFWRYFDPRVLVLALAIFEPEQTQALLGGILQWHFPWRGRWWHVVGSGLAVEPLKGIAPAWPSALQWKSLENCSVITRVLTQIQDTHGAQADETFLSQLMDVNGIVLDARNQLLLEDESDLVGYAFMRWRYGNDLLFHPKLTDAWDQLARRNITWGELTALLDDSDHQAMKARGYVNGIQQEELYATL